MITVVMRRDSKGTKENFVYHKGNNSYTADGWVYVIDEDGFILGSHPQQNVNAVLVKQDEIKAGEAMTASEDTGKTTGQREIS